MTEPNSWDDLFADLGMDQSSPTPAPVPTPAPSPPKAEQHESKIECFPAAEFEPAAIPADESVPVADALEETAASTEVPEPAERSGRGRRRGRRGGRRSTDAPVGEGEAPRPASEVDPDIDLAASTTEAPTAMGEGEGEGETTPAEPGGEEQRRRRRRRRRRSGDREAAAARDDGSVDAVEQSEEDAAPAKRVAVAEADSGDLGDDDEDDLSNWSVPPWQELIASLYRPDR